MNKPLVAVTADVKLISGSPFHAVGQKYLTAIHDAAECVPFIVPALIDIVDIDHLLEHVDGLMLTGSVSNVHPTRYGDDAHDHAEPYDVQRDEVTFALIEKVLAAGVPLMAVCRGFQELNVAMGGTLYAQLHTVEGRDDHRDQHEEDMDVRYGARHAVKFEADSEFTKIAGTTQIDVNSLHTQGIDKIGSGLSCAGVAPDGTIEAVAVNNARAFALGVQWHPEYKPLENEFSTRFFKVFGDAVRDHARGRNG